MKVTNSTTTTTTKSPARTCVRTKTRIANNSSGCCCCCCWEFKFEWKNQRAEVFFYQNIFDDDDDDEINSQHNAHQVVKIINRSRIALDNNKGCTCQIVFIDCLRSGFGIVVRFFFSACIACDLYKNWSTSKRRTMFSAT